jgi:ABC-2 type transport system permease protein
MVITALLNSRNIMGSNRRRTLRWSAWLGWLLESNWTEPWLFIVYVLMKPFAGSLVLVCMYYAAKSVPGSNVPDEFLPFLYIGNACFGLVSAMMFGTSFAVVQDREHYGMLKYIYIGPSHLPTYFIGRGLSGGMQALLGGIINLSLGAIAFPAVRNALFGHSTEWLWLFVYLAIGAVLLTSLGLILAAAVLNMARQGYYVSEGLSGLMYLLCGVVFPISALPDWLRAIGLCLPPTYWLEGVRRSLLGQAPDGPLNSPLRDWSHAELAGMLAISTAVLSAFGWWFFQWSERRAWRNGRIEEKTGA